MINQRSKSGPRSNTSRFASRSRSNLSLFLTLFSEFLAVELGGVENRRSEYVSEASFCFKNNCLSA